MDYRIYGEQTAPEAARKAREGVKNAIGFVPKMLGTMAGAPPVLEAYQTVAALFDKTSLSASERKVVMLNASAEHGCEYFVSASEPSSCARSTEAMNARVLSIPTCNCEYSQTVFPHLDSFSLRWKHSRSF